MDSSSPSTCLSLSSSDLFASPSNSSLASWPSSPTSSKRTAPAAAAAAARFSSSPSKRRHGGQLDHHQDIDCTLSLGNAATRKSEEAPSRLSRAGSPVEDRGGGGGGHGGGSQQFHWLRAQQQCDLAGEAATRNLASLRRLQQVDAAAQPSSYQSILAAQNSHFPPYIPCTSSTKLGVGLLDFSPTHHCSSSSTLSGFLDLNTKFTSVDSCGTRSRFRGGGDGQHNDPRNVPRICAHCGTGSTPLWRNGPLGPKSLCNACGIRFKKVGRRSPTTTAAATPPVSSWSMQVPAAAAFHQDSFGMRSSSSEGIAPPMASPLVVQRDNRNCIPFAREWSESTSSSNYAVGSSCITWQDSSSSLPSSFDSASNMRRLVSSSSSRPSAVLEAEVIRSSDDRRRAEQGSFLKIAL